MLFKVRVRLIPLIAASLLLNLANFLALPGDAQVNELVRAPARITQPVDESSLVTLHGNTHPLAQSRYDRGPGQTSMSAGRLLLILRRSAQQEAELDTLLRSLQDARSLDYHRWLTPDQFGRRFGASDADISTVQRWLQSHGFTINNIAKGRLAIEFSGTVGQVQAAFHTAIHHYSVNGKQHWANATDPQIPAALAPIVAGLASLNDFVPKAQVIRGPTGVYNAVTRRIEPAYTVGNDNIGYTIYMGPADAATIYDTPTAYNPNLSGPSYDGDGVTIGIAGDSNIDANQNAHYRATFSLPINPPTIIVDGNDPGENGDAIEAYLDTEVSGGLAPKASVVLYTAADTALSSGLLLAMLRAIDDNQADILSVSFSECERAAGNSGNLYISNLYQQAAAQGISVVVSSGDSGSAGCDDPNSEVEATLGLAVNGLASTPYNIAVGGTDFITLNSNLPTSFTNYVDVTNAFADHRSALGYIPEEPWNDSTANTTTISQNIPWTAAGSVSTANIMAGGGGVSGCAQQNAGHCTSGYPLPSWQTGFAISNSGRNLPDVSLLAGNGLYGAIWGLCTDQDSNPATGGVFIDCAGTPTSGSMFNLTGVGGTSAAAPAFAGMLALVRQKVGSRLGQADDILYRLAGSAYSAVYHDVTVGNNSVPCSSGTPDCANNTAGYDFLTGYDSAGGYDAATGLGSLDAAQLVSNWGSPGLKSTTSLLTLNGATTSLSLTHGAEVRVNVGVSGSDGTPSGNIALVDSIDPAKLPNNDSLGFFSLAGGSASATTSALPGGSYSVSAHYPGDATFAPSDSNSIAVNVGAESSTTTLKVVAIADPATGKPATTPYYGFLYQIDAQPYGNSASPITPNGAATGTVTFQDNGRPLGTSQLASDGIAEILTGLLPAGNNSLAAIFSGDPSFQPSTSAPVVFAVKPAPTALRQPAIQAATNTAGSPQTITTSFNNDSVGVPPTGNVTILVDAKSIGTAPVAGQPVAGSTAFSGGTASLITTLIPSGAHNVTAMYNGDSNYAASPVSSARSVTISPAPANLTLVPNPSTIAANQSLQVTATVSTASGLPSATGTVILATTGYTAPSAKLVNGAVAITVPANTLPVGADTITVAYSGDMYYNAENASVPVQVSISTIPTVSLKGTSVTLTAGATTGNTSTVSVTPSGGFTGAVAMSAAISNSPSGAVQLPALSFGATSPVSINSADAATATLTITTTSPVSPSCGAALHSPPRAPWYSASGAVLALLVCGISGRRRWSRGILGGMLLFIVLTSGVVACGGGTTACTSVASPGTTPGNYTVTVKGTSGAITATTTVALTVN